MEYEVKILGVECDTLISRWACKTKEQADQTVEDWFNNNHDPEARKYLYVTVTEQ